MKALKNLLNRSNSENQHQHQAQHRSSTVPDSPAYPTQPPIFEEKHEVQAEAPE